MPRAALALVVVSVAFLGLGTISPAAPTKAQLRVTTLSPLAVTGSGFHAGEDVRVSVRADKGAGARSDKAGAAGRIGVRFPKLKLGRCATYVISAKGDEGSRATLRSIPRPCGIDR